MTKKELTILLLLFCGAFLTVACRQGGQTGEGERSAVSLERLDSSLQAGDLVFRRGSGLVSRAVTTIDPRDGGFSHIGIIVKDQGIWKVVHAVPGEPDFKGDPDRVKMETLRAFFDPGRAVTGAVMRVRGRIGGEEVNRGEEEEVLERVARRAIAFYRAGTLFDHAYDRGDTTKMYCTELIDFIYRREGIDLSGGRTTRVRVPGFNGDYLLPGDIQQSERLWMIYQF